MQTAKVLNARRVVAVGRDARRLETALSLGADAAIALDDPRGLADAMRAETSPGGPTLVFDALWGEPLVAALQVAAHGARVINLGQSASPEAVIASALVRGKELDLLGYTNVTVPFDVLTEGYLDAARPHRRRDGSRRVSRPIRWRKPRAHGSARWMAREPSSSCVPDRDWRER